MEPTENHIRDYSSAKSMAKKVLLRRIKRQLAEQGLGDKQIEEYIKKLKAASSNQSNPTVSASGRPFYTAIDALNIVGTNNKPITRLTIEETGLKNVRIIIRNPSAKTDLIRATGNNFASYLESLSPEKSENVANALKRIRAKIKELESVEVNTQRVKMIKAEKSQFLGANDLSKATKREAIYAFWEDTSKKFTTVEKTLTNLIEAASSAELFDTIIRVADENIERITKEIEKEPNTEQKQGLIMYRAAKVSAESKKANYSKKIEEIKSLSNKPLEYIVKVGKASAPLEKDPIDRVLSGIARFEAAEGRMKFQGSGIEEDDKLQIGGWAESYMESVVSFDQSGVASLTAEIEDGKETADSDEQQESVVPPDLGEKFENADADPLLAREMERNQKLMSIDEESKEVLKEMVSMLKEGETYINYVSNLDEMLLQLEDSVIFDLEEYYLPIDTLAPMVDMFESSTFVTAENNQSVTLKGMGSDTVSEVVTNIEKLFSEILAIFSESKYSFINYPTGNKGSAGSNTDYSEARKLIRDSNSIGTKKLNRIFTQGKRRAPVIPPKEGALLSTLDEGDVADALNDFLEACVEYYIKPFNKGYTVTYPKYLSFEDAKAISALSQKAGNSSALGNISTQLATVGNTKISSGTLRSLAVFLGTLDEPSILVTDKLVKQGEQFANALTRIFGQKEDNLNTVAAILFHYMEKTGIDDAKTKKLGEGSNARTIDSRQKEFNASAKNPIEYPIYALYPFLVGNEGLLTRRGDLARSYKAIMTVYEEVKDDLGEVLKRLIEAHTEIRKAMGKKVVYGMLSPTHNGYDKIIDYMYKSEKIDLSHLEAENIVKSLDSHSNIGKEYGITEEQVYLIKANFR